MSNRLKLDVLFILCTCPTVLLTLTVLILYMTNTAYIATVAQSAMKFDMDMHGSQRIISEELVTP